MQERAELIAVRPYGKVHVKLKSVLNARGISRNYLARSINARFEVVDKWYNDQVSKLDGDILARMCFVLQCQIEDIIEYLPPDEAEAAK